MTYCDPTYKILNNVTVGQIETECGIWRVSVWIDSVKKVPRTEFELQG